MGVYLPILITTIIFGSFGVLARTLSIGYGLVEILLAVNLVQMAVFLLISFKSIRHVKVNFLLIAFAICSSLPLLFFNLSLKFSQLGLVLLIQNTSTVIFSVFLDWKINKVKFHYIKLGLITIVLLELLTLFYYTGERMGIVGPIFACITGLLNVLNNQARKELSKNFRPEHLGLLAACVGSLIWIFFSILNNINLEIFSLGDTKLASLLVIYGLLNVVTTYLLVEGFKKANLTIGNILLTGEILVGLILANIFFHETIPMIKLISGGVIYIAIILLQYVDKEMKEGKSRNY